MRSHADGISQVPLSVQRELHDTISSIVLKPGRGSASRIRDAITERLLKAGWSGKVSVASGSNITISAMRSGIGLCLQTGNMARMYADLLKLQTLFLENAIVAAIIIVPSRHVAKALGENIAQAERLDRELEIFAKAYQVPTLLVSLE